MHNLALLGKKVMILAIEQYVFHFFFYLIFRRKFNYNYQKVQMFINIFTFNINIIINSNDMHKMYENYVDNVSQVEIC